MNVDDAFPLLKAKVYGFDPQSPFLCGPGGQYQLVGHCLSFPLLWGGVAWTCCFSGRWTPGWLSTWTCLLCLVLWTFASPCQVCSNWGFFRPGFHKAQGILGWAAGHQPTPPTTTRLAWLWFSKVCGFLWLDQLPKLWILSTSLSLATTHQLPPILPRVHRPLHRLPFRPVIYLLLAVALIVSWLLPLDSLLLAFSHPKRELSEPGLVACLQGRNWILAPCPQHRSSPLICPTSTTWCSGAEGWRSRRSSRAKLPSNGLCKAWNPLKGWDTSFLQRRKQGPISLQQVGDTSQDVRVSRCWRDRSSYGGLGLIASSLGVPRGGFPTLCVGSGNFGTWRRGRHYRSHHCRGRDDAAAGLFGCPARISSFSRSAGARHVGRTRCVGRAFNKSGGASGSNGRRHLAACSSTRCWKAPYSFACGFCQPCILRPQGALLRRSFTDHSLRPARRSPGAMARRCCCACSCMGRRSCGLGGFRTYPILLSRRSPRDTASSCSEKIYQKTHSRWWFRWRRSNCSRSKEETHSGATCREPGSLDSFPSWHHQQTPGALRENQCNGDRAGSHIRRQTISLETASWVVSFNWVLAQVQPSAAGQGDASSQKFICSYEGPKSFFCSRRGGGDGFRPPPGLGPPGTGHADAEQGHHRLGYPAGCEQQRPFAGLGEHSQLSFQQRCSREGKAADRTCISQRSFLASVLQSMEKDAASDASGSRSISSARPRGDTYPVPREVWRFWKNKRPGLHHLLQWFSARGQPHGKRRGSTLVRMPRTSCHGQWKPPGGLATVADRGSTS